MKLVLGEFYESLAPEAQKGFLRTMVTVTTLSGIAIGIPAGWYRYTILMTWLVSALVVMNVWMITKEKPESLHRVTALLATFFCGAATITATGVFMFW